MRKLSCMLDLWLFEQLAPEERRQLEPLTRKLSYVRGQRLFSEGDRAAVVLLVTSGRVKLYKLSSDGKEVILGFLGSHDLLGEETLIREGTRPFSAEALEPTTACGCSKDDLEALATQHPSIAAKLTRTLGEKLTQTADQLADIAMYDVRERLIRLLARLAQEQGDAKYPEAFDDAFARSDGGIVKTPFLSPIANCYIESWIVSLKREALNHFFCFSLQHLDYITAVYLEFCRF